MQNIVDQMFNGKKGTKTGHEKLVFDTSLQLAESYEIIFDENELVPSDSAMADRTYLAALDLVETTGFFTTGTNRVVRPERYEVIESMQNVRSSVTLGEGIDSTTIYFREVLDRRMPSIWGGPCSAPASEEYYVPIHRSYAKLKAMEMLSPASMVNSFKGALLSTPMELYNAYNSIEMVKSACTRESRPKMCYSTPPSIGDIRASLSIANDNFTGKETMHEIYSAVDMKVNVDSITKSIHYGRMGLPYLSDQIVILGGNTVETPEQLAILIIAEAIKSRIINGADIYFSSPTDSETGASSTAKTLWASGISSLALTRNTKILHGLDIVNTAGPCTEMMFYETAVQTISAIVCGVDILAGPAPNSMQMIDHAGGLDALFMLEMAELATNLSFEDANKLCNKLYKKYSKHLNRPELGKHFIECYDIKRIVPTPEYAEMHNKVLNEVYSLAGQ
ncbi:monomethylamine:corrinoid methyltransferase [Methanococcoides methylutens]|uniref:monomethylamine:corrinoid methyltransferase n=1 Tax=Methanococcoides methylutens TaxID=2226 RepID=UPI004043ABDE